MHNFNEGIEPLDFSSVYEAYNEPVKRCVEDEEIIRDIVADLPRLCTVEPA